MYIMQNLECTYKNTSMSLLGQLAQKMPSCLTLRFQPMACERGISYCEVKKIGIVVVYHQQWRSGQISKYANSLVLMSLIEYVADL